MEKLFLKKIPLYFLNTRLQGRLKFYKGKDKKDASLNYC